MADRVKMGILKKELREQGMPLALALLLYVALFLLNSSPLVGEGDRWRLAGSLWPFAFSFVLLCVLLGSCVIAGEKEKGTIHFLLHLPLPQTHILLLKWLAALLYLFLFLMLELLLYQLLNQEGFYRDFNYWTYLANIILFGLTAYFWASFLSCVLDCPIHAFFLLLLCYIAFVLLVVLVVPPEKIKMTFSYLRYLVIPLGITGSLLVIKRIPAK